MLRLCRVDCKCCFHPRPRSLPTANLQLEPYSHRGGKWYRRLISSTAWPSAQLNSGFEPKNQLLRSFYVMWTQQKTSAGGDREQLMLLLFICSKTGKGKLTRRLVILRLEIQNLKEQFTPNSRLHVFPHPVLLDCVGVGSPLLVILFFLNMKCTVVLEAPRKHTWKPLCRSHDPVSHEVRKLCCEQFHVGTIFFLPNYNHPTVCSGKRARTRDGTLIPVTGCKHWPSPF